jgi:outer membrane protein TolC
MAPGPQRQLPDRHQQRRRGSRPHEAREELNIATQVRDAGRQLVANAKRVDATQAARVLAERRLEAEEKKFAAGMSTSFEVFQAQRDLALARSNELRAVLDYNQSQVAFETVQVAPTSGGGASFNVGTALGGAVGAGAAGAATTPQQ